MYPYSIREIRLESGERFPLLVYSDPLGLPVPGATEFGLVKLRARGLKRSSIRQRTDALGWILYFLDSKKIDLVKKAADGFFLSLNELVALADHCRARRKPAKGLLVISVTQAAVHYSLALDYIEWVSEPVIARMTDPRRRESANIALARFHKRAKSVAPKPRGQDSHINGERHGLEENARTLFLKVIQPGDPGNPFSARYQVRNYALLLLAFRLGARSGEIRGLKKFDLNLDSVPAQLTIMPRYHDADDKRLDPAAAKTNGRYLEFHSELKDALENWLHDRKSRATWPRAHRNPYVFVNRFGDAIEGRGYRKVIETLRLAHPELEGLCHHMLRHDWNERWVQMVDDDGVEFAKAETEQKYAMGWSPNSKMPLRYGRRATAKASNKRILKLQKGNGAHDE
ncbi:phage integrase family protein [Paraburkholderia sp. BL23I1N1]|uniref:site-specific integrase n=1 Tax=Paraburkholderia sp. BL23I1N1 TaxID=1938802 RepID=UPI000E7463AD|nr:site-specific integrase [Paraburkholderia sp. BL23I1N1]RKE25871.1 phage integrase family protein [Paraburkholderia sp. BL23I1N1]